MSLSPSYQRLQLGEEAKKAAGLIAWFLVVGIVSAHAQDPGTLNPEPLPPLPNPDSPAAPARELFARKTTPLPGPPRSIGSYQTVVLPALSRCQSRDQLGR